ncbi:MAG: non-heme iron oxygenase ferredoxin subunit [Hydrogenophaga sp.]|nr:non-heme iron oxygenase ferredoxin subunit [Hydrogenophaga sp.]
MSNWTDVAAETELFEGAGIPVAPTGHDIAVYLLDGQVFATDNLCTHGHAKLCDGFLEGFEIECPFHQGRFDIRTGEATAPPCTEAIRRWPVKIEGGRVLIDLG